MGDVIHLWDEPVEHFIWFAGFSVMVMALAMSFDRMAFDRAPGQLFGGQAGRNLRRTGIAVALALLVGITYATNSLEGHFAVPGLIFAVLVSAWAVRRRVDGRRSAAVDVAGLAFGTAFFLLGCYGIWHRGFPEPTSIGWNIMAL